MRYRLRVDRLAELLMTSRLSQNHWAIRLGLSRGHWSDIVHGRHPFPSAKTRERMLEVFGVPLEELFAADNGRADEIDFRLAIAHRYEILSELGQGAMGAVHLATDRALGRLVAMKVVSPEAAAGVGSETLLKEIAFVARLQHPNILPLFDAGEAAGHPYYVMPFVREGSLRTLLDRTGRLESRDALPLLAGIANGLSYAHERQTLHCDVKPENVLVQDHHCFVMDFGIARKLRSEAREWAAVRTELDLSAGTPAYVSPEQASGRGDVDQRSDIYSLACVAFEMLSGHAPFGGRDTEEIVSRRFHEPPPALDLVVASISHATALVLTRALSLDPSCRPESAREFVEDLRHSLATRVAMPSSPALEPSPRPRRRHARSTRLKLHMHRIVDDLRISLRGLRAHWRFSVGVMLTLGLGVGLGVPALSLADNYFLRAPSGVRDADRVVRLVERNVDSRGPFFTDGMTGLDYTTLVSRATTLDGVAGWIILSRSLGRGADARAIHVGVASPSLFTVLGTRPALGRFYSVAEDVEANDQPPCVVSYAFWKTSLGGASNVLGQRLLIGSRTYTIVGVGAEGFNGVELGAVDAWVPLRVASPEFNGNDPLLWTTDHSSWLRMVARLKPGVSLEQATAEAAVLYRTAGPRTRDPALRGTFLWDPLQPGRSSLADVAGKIALWLSAGGVLLLLLISANLANLFIARDAARERQTAVRLAIGGSWRDILRLQLTEVAILGTCAALLGLIVAAPAVGVARSLLMPGMTWSQPRFDARIAGIAFGIALCVGLIAALWSTAQSARVRPATLLHGGASRSSDARRAHAVRRGLLIAQSAIFAVLLTSAAGFVTSLRRALSIDFGFDPSRVIAVSMNLPAETPRAQLRALVEEARNRAAALPGVASASLGYMEPWQNNTGSPISTPESTVKAPYSLFDFATPEYLETFGLRMRAGRWISTSDLAATTPIVVLNETLAKTLWPRGDAIGKCLRIGDDTMPCRAVVGIVQDFRVTGALDDAPMPVEYVPYAQAAAMRQTPKLFVRPRGDPIATSVNLRRALQTLDPRLPAISVRVVSANTRPFAAPLQLGAAAFTSFGIVAAIVAAIGLYCVLSFLIVEQRRSNAIRLAIGAAPSTVARSVFQYGVGTAVTGIVVGWIVLIPLRRVIEPLLYHTTLLDAPTLTAVALFGSALAILAALTPARAVARTDIISVLREQ